MVCTRTAVLVPDFVEQVMGSDESCPFIRSPFTTLHHQQAVFDVATSMRMYASYEYESPRSPAERLRNIVEVDIFLRGLPS